MWQKCIISILLAPLITFLLFAVFPEIFEYRDFSMAFLGLDRRHHLYLQSSVLSDLWHRGLGDFIANNKAKDKKIQSAIIIFVLHKIFWSLQQKSQRSLGNTFRNMIYVTNFRFVPSVSIFSPIFDQLQHPAIDPALSDNISRCLVVVTVYEFGVRLQTLVKGCVFRTTGERLASSYDFIQSLGNTFRVLIDKVAVITGLKTAH